MKSKILLMVLISFPFFGYAQWVENGGYIYYAGGVKVSTSNYEENTAKLQVLYNISSNARERNAVIELGRNVNDDNSHKWRFISRSTYPWGNFPTLSIQYLHGGVYSSFMTFKSDGNIGIGTSNTGTYKLAVNGAIRAKEIKVETGWADFVFEENYPLRSLAEVEAFIKENGHLPDIPSAEEVEENGVNVGEMEAKLLQKIEELTLYVIEQSKNNEILLEEIEELKEVNKTLLKRIETLESLYKTASK